MNFLKKNILLVSLFGIFAILLGVSVYFLMDQMAKSDAVSAKVTETLEIRNNKYKMKVLSEEISVNKESIEKFQQRVDAEKKVVNQLLVETSKANLLPDRIRGTDFQMKKRKSFEDLRVMLAKKSVECSDKQFGFKEYQNTPPNDPDTVMLQKQLTIVEEFIRIAVSAEVREIRTIRLVSFKKLDNKAADPALGTAGIKEAKEEPLFLLGESFKYKEDLGPGYVYNLMPFDFEVYGSPTSFAKLLNGISKSDYILLPWLVTVKTCRFNGESSSPGQYQPTKSFSPVVGKLKPATENTDRKPINIVNDPFVIGGEILQVNLRICWVEMKPPPAANPPRGTNKPAKKP